MTTLIYDDHFPLTTMEKNGATSSVPDGTIDKPGLLARMLDALGRTYYIETPDGEGYYFLPPF